MGDSAERGGGSSPTERLRRPALAAMRVVAAVVLLLALLDVLLWSENLPAGWPAPLLVAAPFLLSLAWLLRPGMSSRAACLGLAWGLAALLALLVFWPGEGGRSPAPPLALAGAALGLVARALSGRSLTDRLSRFAGGFLLSLGVLALSVTLPHEESPLPMGLSLAVGSLWLGLWLLRTGLRAGHQPAARVCIALLAGLCLLVMVGWVLDSHVIVQGGTQRVPMQFNTALCGGLLALSLSLLLAWRKRLALVPLVPVLLISLASLGEEYLGWRLGTGEWLFRHGLIVEGVMPGHMAPNSAVAWLLASLGVLLAPGRPGRADARWVASWACGLMLVVIAGTVVLGYLTELPAIRGWGSYTPMALMTGMAVLLLGLALVFAGASRQREMDTQRGVWIPVGVGLAAVALSVSLWLRFEREQRMAEQAIVAGQVEVAVNALDQGMRERQRALDRLALRLSAIADEDTRERLFARDARSYLRDFGSLVAIAWLDADAGLRQAYWREPMPDDGDGGRMDPVPLSPGLLARARAGEAVWPRAVTLPDGRPGDLVVVPVRAAENGAEIIGYVAATVALESLIGDLLEGVAAGHALQVRQGGQLLYARELPRGGTVISAPLPLLEDASVEVWPRPAAGRARIAEVILFAGLVTGGLLALALRMAALAARRARDAEDSSRELRRQVDEAERARAALGAAEHELSQVFDSISDAFYTLDQQWRFVLVNPRAEQLMRRPRAELLGRTVWECFPEANGTIIEDNFRAAQTERRTVEFEVYFPPLAAWFYARVFPHPAGIAVYFQDISDRKGAEALRVRAQAASAHAQRLARLGSWEYDLATGELAWSDEVYRIFGLDPARSGFGLHALLERVHFEDRHRLQEAQRRLHAGEGDMDIEYRVMRADGQQRVVREIGTLLRDADGNPTVASGAIQDVTEQRAAQDGLRELAKRLEQSLMANRQVMEHSLDAICVLDANGRFLQVSDAAREIWGHAPNELVGRAWLDLVHPDDRGRALRVAAEVTSGKPVSDLRIRCVNREGQVLVTQWSLRWSLDNRLTFAVARDVTALERQERALRESEARMRSTVDSALDCIVVMSAEGLILDFNPAAERTFGYRREDVLGRELAELLVPERLREQHRQGLARLLEGGPARLIGQRVELPALRADGSEIIVELTITRPAGVEPPVFTSFMRDITDAHRARALEEGQHRILAGIASRRPLAESLEAITRLAEQQFPGSLSSVLLLDDAGVHLLTGAAPSLPEAYSQAIHGTAIGPKTGSCGTAAWRGEMVIVTDIQTDPLWEDYRQLAAASGLAACWSIPVKSAGGKVLATFATYYRQPREPTAEELKLMDTMAAITAVAIEQDKAFRELALSEQRFRSLFDEHPDAVYSMDLEGRFTAVNDHFATVTGLQPEQVLGKPFDFLVAEEHREATREHFRAACNGAARQYEITVQNPEGRRWHMRITNLPMVVQGQVTGVFGIAHDITMLRRHQQELAEALNAAETTGLQLRRLSDAAIRFSRRQPLDDLYQQLADALRETIGAHQAVITLNLQDGPAHHVNAASLSDKYAQWRQYSAPLDGSGIYAMVLESGRPMRMTQAQLEAHPRWRGFGAEAGRHPPMRGWLAVPMLGSDGKVMGLLQLSDKYAGEFSEQDELVAIQFAKMASDAVERNRLIERLQVRDRFFEMSVELFVIFDPVSRHFVEVNQKLEEVFGYGREDLLSREYTEFMHPDDRERVLARLPRKAWTIPGEQESRVRYVRSDGAVRWVEWLSTGGPDGLVYAVGRDITEKRAAEEALARTLADLDARNRELQDFAFIASHDLQEPLRKIRAFSDRLQRRYASELSAEAADYLARSHQAAERMQGLIDDLLAYSRVARGKPFSRVDLNTVLASVLEDLEERLESSGGQVEAGLLPSLEADPTQMRQLLQNLVANALKFRSPERPPRVRIRAEAIRLDGAPAWELRVEDNGIGFEPRHAAKVFAPFQRLHARAEYEGTGIGLAIVRRIVERHRGTVRAEGRPGEGACFVIQLPEMQNQAADHGFSADAGEFRS